MLNLKVLRIVQRIAVNRAYFALGGARVLPNQIRETLGKIFVDQRATAGLKEGPTLQFMRAVKIGHQRLGRFCGGDSWLASDNRGAHANNQSQEAKVTAS